MHAVRKRHPRESIPAMLACVALLVPCGLLVPGAASLPRRIVLVLVMTCLFAGFGAAKLLVARRYRGR